MAETDDLDLIVIGAGTGGIGVARACRKAGWRVAIIDALPYGGTCALRGCDPKKMLVGVTEALDWSRRMIGKGLNAESMRTDWADLMAFKRSFTEAMPGRVEGGLERAGVATVHGAAEFVSRDTVCVDGTELTARHFHIATGARPRELGIPGEELVATSTDFLELESLPSRIVFVGGGYISFEFAHIARRAGAAEVTILHRSERPLKGFDPDLVNILVERTRALGIDVRLRSCVEAVAADDGALRVDFSAPGGPEGVHCDAIFHGAGRVPNVAGLRLDAAGVDVGPGGVVVSDFMRSVSNNTVFAAGDCADTAAPSLTPVSALEARVAFKNLLAGADERRAEYPPIPSAVFTVPPLGRVGLLEEEADHHGLSYEVSFKETGDWYSSMRVGEERTAFKTLIAKDSGKILGAHVLGPGAEEQLNLFALAMKHGLTANDLKATMFAYPSYASDLGYMV